MAFGYFPPRGFGPIYRKPITRFRLWRRGQDNLLKRLTVEETFRHLDLKYDDVVLEIGAGGLHYAGEIAKRSAKVVATDIAEHFEEQLRARRFPENLQVQRSDCTVLPYGDEIFDKIFISEVFPVLDQEKAIRCVQEAHRLLKIGGKLVTVNGRQPNLLKEVINTPEGRALLSRNPETKEFAFEDFGQKFLELHSTKKWFFEDRDAGVRNVLRSGGFNGDFEESWAIGPKTESEYCLILLENFVSQRSFLLGENQVRYLGRLRKFERFHSRAKPGFAFFCSAYRQ